MKGWSEDWPGFFNSCTDDMHTAQPNALEKLWLLWSPWGSAGGVTWIWMPRASFFSTLISKCAVGIWLFYCHRESRVESVGSRCIWNIFRRWQSTFFIVVFWPLAKITKKTSMAKTFSSVSGISCASCALSLKKPKCFMLTTSHAQNYTSSPDVCTLREMLSFAVTADF